ncbi:MAG: response regulator transcription factor [Propionibacteriaceae bacterium]|jgi:two-component system response regulator MtrA|nr:response regulator transcription factor [Propionibacteriaceae bacterium]
MSDSTRAFRVLVVEDDEALAEMLSIHLGDAGYKARLCHRGDLALAEFEDFEPDLVLLDLMLPGRDGVDVCRDIRDISDIPIVMLTAKSDTNDVVDGLEAGADDYIPKPFKAEELLARIKTRLRRRSGAAGHDGPLRIGDLDINVTEHRVRRGEEELRLTPLEFDLLLTLAQHPKQAFSRERLLREVWKYPSDAGDTRLVNVHVQRLRAKVEIDAEAPEIVVTVRGVGYRAGEPRLAPGESAVSTGFKQFK